jgi:hypothetical protein
MARNALETIFGTYADEHPIDVARTNLRTRESSIAIFVGAEQSP